MRSLPDRTIRSASTQGERSVSRTTRILIAEAIGTLILMLGGPGTAVLAGDAVGVLGIALGFGFALMIAAYAIGPISGCHINPAVTVGLLLARKIDSTTVPFYLGGQVIGAVAGGFAVWGIRNGQFDDFDAAPDTFAANLWGQEHGFANFGAMAITEILLTGLLVLVVLSTTRRGFPPAAIGLTVGIALTLIHLISIPVDNTSVNPARSLGTAIFAGGAAMEQLWAFIVFPVVGAALGAVTWMFVSAGLDDEADDPGRSVIDLRSTADGTMTTEQQALVGAPQADAPATGAAGAAGAAAGVIAQPFGPGSHAALDDPLEMPEGHPIKGKANSKLYHRPDSRNYASTKADVWFDTPESAEAAGFSAAKTHPKD